MREKILSATAKIIATEGLDAVSIRHVCDKVDVKAPTVYYYFKDKAGLIDAVVALAYTRYAKKQAEHVKGSTSETALVKSWDIFFKFVDEETDLFHAVVIAHLRQRIPPEGYALFQVIADMFTKLESRGKLKVPALTAARIYYATAYGLALVYISQGKTATLKPNIDLTRDLCIQSLLG